MPDETIKQVLMRRDNNTEAQAEQRIQEAQEQLNRYLENGNMTAAYNICEEYFGLEPDYLTEIMPV